MRAMICDKCKSVYADESSGRPKYQITEFDLDDHNRTRGERYVDLCPVCYDQLVAFLTKSDFFGE